MEAKQERNSDIFAAYEGKCNKNILTYILDNYRRPHGILVRVTTNDNEVIAGKVEEITSKIISVTQRKYAARAVMDLPSNTIPVTNIGLLEYYNEL